MTDVPETVISAPPYAAMRIPLKPISRLPSGWHGVSADIQFVCVVEQQRPITLLLC